MDPYAKPKERNIGARRPKIRHVSQSVEPRTRRERQAEKQGVAAERLRVALKYCAPEHLIASTDCGMVPLPIEIAEAKIRALGAGTALINKEIG